MSQKIFRAIILSIVGSAALVAGVSWSLSRSAQTSRETPSVSSIDETWNLYKNSQLGFSMKLPKQMAIVRCRGLLEEMAPVKVFADETNQQVFITSEYYYRREGESCTKEDTSLASSYEGWLIYVRTVANDAALERFIKEHYDEDCVLKEKTPSSVSGIFNVSFGPADDSGEFDPEKCWINAALALKYSPTKQRTATWTMGQDFTFYGTTNLDKKYLDKEMADSFRFE